MAENSVAENFGKVVLGGAVGFALYLFVTGLGLGGRGRGEGEGRDEGRGEGRDEVPPTAPSSTAPSRPKEHETPPLPPTPLRPKDSTRLTFVMTQPLAGEPYNPMTFLLPADGKTYSLGGLITRVKAGGRSDVALKIRGDVRTGSADEALAFIKKAGLEVWEEGVSLPRVSGDARGHYGRGYYRGYGR